MTTFRIYEHPVHGQTLVPMGFSWAVFFFGSIWALLTRTWIVLWVHVGLWLVLAWLRYEAEGASPENKVFAVLLFYGVGLGVNVLISANASQWRAEGLEDRGYQNVKTLRGPTKDFVLAELARAKQQAASAE